MMTGDFDVRPRGGHAVVALCGELDLTSSAEAMSAVTALVARHQVVIVELSALDFMDCGALRALLKVQRLARRSGGDVLLAAPKASVRRLLSLTSTDAAIGVHATVDAAVASIAWHQESGACRRREQTGRTAQEPPVLSRSPG